MYMVTGLDQLFLINNGAIMVILLTAISHSLGGVEAFPSLPFIIAVKNM